VKLTLTCTPSSDPAQEAQPLANGTLGLTLFDERVKAKASRGERDSAAPGLVGVVTQSLRP
jgi:hypothetical protein